MRAVELVSAVVVSKPLKPRRRHSTVSKHGTGVNDVRRDVTDDAMSVGVADWLTVTTVGVVSNGEEGLVDVYKVVVWTRHTSPDWFTYTMCH